MSMAWNASSVVYEGVNGVTSTNGDPQYWYGAVPITNFNTITNPGYTISTFPAADQLSGGDMWAVDISGNLHPLGQKEIPEWDD